MTEDHKNLHPHLTELLGTTLAGRYRITSLIGSGGMSAVFAARHLSLGQELAIKVLHPQLSLNTEVGKRFDIEAMVASSLEHNNCCRVTDFGTSPNGMKYMVMPLLRGTELRAALGQPLAPRKAISYTMQLLRGLKHAHSLGVVHRDLKPENIIVTTDHEGHEIIKIADFGISKIIRGGGPKPGVTAVGMIPGTPEYMSPEHARGLPLDGRSDLYSVGLILYEMLTGKPAFQHSNPRELMRMQVFEATPSIPESIVLPPDLGPIINRLLEKDPNDRFFDALGVLESLEPIHAQLEEEAAMMTTWTPKSLFYRLSRWFRRTPVTTYQNQPAKA